MKPSSFDYVKANSTDEVIALLVKYGDDAELIAGGQSLLPALSLRLSAPEILIDINSIGGLGDIHVSDDMLQIGALVRHVEIIESPLIARHLPLLTQAARHVAHATIRNRGSFGGSLANAHPASEFPACAIALGATISLLGPSGIRKVTSEAFFTGLFSTLREPNEILVSVDFPVAGPDDRSVFQELAIRQGDYPLVGLAAKCRLEGARIHDLRLVYLGISDKPERAFNAEQCLEGHEADPQALERAVNEISKDLDPVGDFNASAEYKMHISKVILSRVIKALVGEG